MGNSSFGRVRRTVRPSELWRKNPALLHTIQQSGGTIPVADICVPEMQLHMAEGENRKVQDAARADSSFEVNYLNGVYAPEVENDWAFEFQLTGGGS